LISHSFEFPRQLTRVLVSILEERAFHVNDCYITKEGEGDFVVLMRLEKEGSKNNRVSITFKDNILKWSEGWYKHDWSR
jgi:hypothetical protein